MLSQSLHMFKKPCLPVALLPILSLLMAACGDAPLAEKTAAKPSLQLRPEGNIILLFAKEQQLEFWQNGQLIASSVPFQSSAPLPIGVYRADRQSQAEGSLTVLFPTTYYRQKTANLKQTLHTFPPESTTFEIRYSAETLPSPLSAESTSWTLLAMPNDARLSGTFDACIRCPHWMAELYSYLKAELELCTLPTENTALQ